MNNDFWQNIPEDCKKAISELNRLKVSQLLAYDCEESFSDVWWLVLHEVDMYFEGEYCREARRSYWGEGDPGAMNLKQAQRAEAWLVKWNDLFNKYKHDTTVRNFSEDEFYYEERL